MADPTCTTCEGEGRVANTPDREPWSAWENLPPGSDLAVRFGLVQPIPCPACCCPFCDRISRAEFEAVQVPGVVRFEPLSPVIPGHMLFVPTLHAEHPTHYLLAAAMAAASRHGAEQAQPHNLITSAGPAATQTVPHLHVHYVPREFGDGLALPWTGQKRTEEARP